LDNPNEVILLFEVKGLTKAKEFGASVGQGGFRSQLARLANAPEGSRRTAKVRSDGGGGKTLPRMISLISSFMAQLLVRDLEDALVQALRQKAAEEGTSVEEAHRRILRLALLSKKPKKSFKEFLLEMPEAGDDAIFERHRSQPREVLL